MSKESDARYSVTYRANHKTQINEYQRQYRKNYRTTTKVRFGAARGRARRGNIPFDLTFDEYSALLASGLCHYCFHPLAKSGSGLDRKNSSLGYSVENCVPCCHKCNLIRGKDLISYEEMVEVAKLLNRLRNEVV